MDDEVIADDAVGRVDGESSAVAIAEADAGIAVEDDVDCDGSVIFVRDVP